jgi:hypothetical protein
MQWFIAASALMLLRGWFASVVAAAPILTTAITAGVVTAVADNGTAALVAFIVVYWLAGLLIGAVALYGAARLVRVLDELHAARAEPAARPGPARSGAPLINRRRCPERRFSGTGEVRWWCCRGSGRCGPGTAVSGMPGRAHGPIPIRRC